MVSRRKNTRKPRGRARPHSGVIASWLAGAEVVLDPDVEKLVEKIEPDYRPSVEAKLDGSELLAIARAVTKKAPKGRPERSDKWLLLDEIAKRKAADRGYMDLRFRFNRTERQLTDLVHKNKKYIDDRVREIQSK